MKKFIKIITNPVPTDLQIGEHKGKPYYEIEYEENGEIHIGFSSYNLEVISEYIRDYFVNAEKPQGEWIDTGSGQECSQCHEIQYGYDSFRHFCGNCGAKMKGVTK